MTTKRAILGFFEGGESSANVPNPAATDHQPPEAEAEIIHTRSDGCVLLSLLKERNFFEKHDQPTTINFPAFIAAAESDHHEVDTTLTLSTPVSTNPTPPPIIINIPIANPEVADVDTALKLSNITPEKSIDSAAVMICNPTPLRCFHPINFPEASSSSTSTALSLAGPTRTNNRPTAPKRRRVNGDVNKIKTAKRSRSTNGDDQGDRHRPLLPTVGEFPALMQALDSENRSRPVFLYRKKLETSDVRADLNRLFVTRREWLLRFLTAEEEAAVDGTKKGLKVLGLDQGGKSYSLVLKNWESLNVTVINADWNKITAANGAVKDDLVEIWGFRQDGKLGFALIFGRLCQLPPLVI